MTANEDLLPVEDRCVHKLWKVRISGYEDAIKLFRHLDKKSHEWNKFIGIINCFVADSNVVAQEKGLEAALVYVENYESAGRSAEEVVAVLISKCYGAQKEKIRSIAIQITLMFIEIEKQDVVIEELVKGMDHKFPKIVSTCIRAVTQSVKDFGSKVINIKPILKKLQSVLENKDKSVRVEAKLLSVTLYSWVGLAPVKANLTNLKPLQIQDLEVEFEKLTDVDKPQPTRFLRSQKKQTDKIEVEANEDFTEEESVDIVDNFEESIDPVNILGQLNEDFYQKLEVKQWQERKKAIDKLEEMLYKAPKLDIGDYGNLVNALMKMIEKDTNVIIVSIATKCITMLANRLKKRFEIYTSVCIPVFLEKFKEKKPSVVLPLREAIDAIYTNVNKPIPTTLESVHEYVLTTIGSKNPSVRAESVSFLARCFTKCSTTVLNKKMLKICVNALVKTLNESDPTVRNNSAEALGVAWKVVSEKNILPFLTNVDATKLAKIKDAAKNAIITAKPIPSVNECLPKSEEIKETAIINNKSTVLKKNLGNTNKISSISKTKKPNNFDGHKTTQSKAIQVETEIEIGNNELEKLALTIFSVSILNGMIDVNWKTRLSNIQKFSQVIDNIETSTVSSQVLIRLLNKKPGIADGNIQVQKLKLECLKKVIKKFPISSTSVDCCVRDISSLLGSNKNSNLVCEVLTSLAEATTLNLVSNAVLEFVFSAQKNSKVQTEALNWFSSAILEFGFVFEPTTVMQNVKKAMNASNLAVRMAVISLLGVMYLYMGPQLSLFLENEKPSLVQQINAEFAKHKDTVPPTPIRVMKFKELTEYIKDTNDCKKLDFKINLQKIGQRVDITSQITDALIDEMSNKDWNVRSNALTKLLNIISEAKFITSNLGQVQKALQDRLGDSNARLCSNAIHLLELISIAMGSSFKNYIKCYLPGVLNALGDLKTFKFQSALQCMNTWADVCGYREFFGNDIILDALKNNSVTLRSELWTWLAENLLVVPLKTIPADELKNLLPVLYSNFEDKNHKVREASEKVVLGFMMHLGYASMCAACEELKPLSAKLCKEKLDKVRPNSPIISNEKHVKKVVKSGSSIKLKQSKFPPAKDVTKINHDPEKIRPDKLSDFY